MSEELQQEFEDVLPVESLSREESKGILYALLFASDRPLSASRLAEAFGDAEKEVVENLLGELAKQINEDPHVPFVMKEIGGGYQLVTKAAHAPYIRKLFQIKKSRRLSKSVLETLAIVAYKQPVTRAEVEAIRGVSVAHAFDQLLEKRLIKITGVADAPGRPKLHRTSDEFLVQFGLKSLKELPTLEEVQEGKAG
jgi:segregation and condensation protein B